jgi:excisionase family DNA binding protein
MSTNQLRSSLDDSATAPARRRASEEQLQPLLTLDEVAGLLRVSEKTIQRLVAARRMPCVRIGRRLRFVPADVFRFVAARKD